MASSPLPCPLIHRLINGGRKEERPGLARKTKDALVARGTRKKAEACSSRKGGPCRGWQEGARTSQREGQNARQGQGHRVRSRREVGEGRCKDRGTGQGQRGKDRQSQRIKMKSNRAKEGMDRDGDMQGRRQREARLWSARPALLSAYYVLALLCAPISSSWQP